MGELLGKNIKISEILNDTFIDIFNEYDLSYSFIWSNSISEEKVIEHFHKLDKQKVLDLLEIRQLSTKFIDIIFHKYKDKFDFNIISQHQNLTFDFILQNKDKISLQALSFNENLNEEQFLKIYEIKDQFNDDFDWEYISEYVDFSKESEEKISELHKELLIKKNLKINYIYLKEYI